MGGTNLVGNTTDGYTLTYKESLYGGSKDSPVDSTEITMEGGTLGYIYTGGESDGATVTGDVQFTMTGGNIIHALYGGSDDTVSGNVTVNIFWWKYIRCSLVL